VAEQICARIKGVEMQVRRVPGTALANQTNSDIIYTPPVGLALLRQKLANWEFYLHEQQDLDSLIRMAVGHYQFETIHPFTNGNGRTGRVLNILYLTQENLLTLPILYLSRYIINNKADYYRFLLGVTRYRDWEYWLYYLIQGVAETALWTTAKIAAIRALHNMTIDHVKKPRLKFIAESWWI